MNRNKEKSHMVDVLFVIALFFVFALSSLMLVVIGANVYQRTVENMDDSYRFRTTSAYITEKFRQNDAYESIEVGKIADSDALIFSQTIHESKYHTYLYLYDNQLKELFVKEGNSLGPNAGQDILPLTDFSIQVISDDLFQFSLTDLTGKTTTLLISSHCNS